MSAHRVAFILLILSLLTGCTAPTPQPVTLPAPPQITLLRQVSSFPLYEAHIAGDYGFGEYLKTGVRPIRQAYCPLCAAQPAARFACSCFAALGNPENAFMGRNFDWYENPALLLFTNPPGGYASVSMVDISYLGYTTGGTDPLTKPARLLEAPYLPFDGMNNQGLAVGMMAVGHAEGGSDPSRMTLDELELMRLMLDYARDVPEALRLIQDYNVDFGSVPVHFLVVDAGGRSAVIEYIQGAPVVLPNDQPWQVSTNFLISEEKPQQDQSSCWRYNRLFSTLQKTKGSLADRDALLLLKDVSQAGKTATRWSVIYHLSSREVSLVVGRDFEQVYEFSLIP